MDNFFDLLPFIIAIIVFITRLLSGNKENKPKPQEPTSENPTSFDDLLKQITKQINEAKNPNTATAKEEKEKSLQEQRLERQKEKAKKAAIEAKKLQEKLQSAAYVEKGITNEQRQKDQHFNPYKIKTASKNPYNKLLSERENLKNAIILNEILKPKHF
jgi:type IV secretory pathway VirB10-like protein